MDAQIVLSTASNPDEAAKIARALVEQGLAACVNLVPGTQSVYRWQGAVEEATETLLLIKTTREQLPALEVELHRLHSYQTPEFLVLDIAGGATKYLDWLRENVR